MFIVNTLSIYKKREKKKIYIFYTRAYWSINVYIINYGGKLNNITITIEFMDF